MGLYIKGKQMSKEIYQELIMEFAEGLDGARYARFYDYSSGCCTEWHEVTDVSEPHGRLIDADALDIHQRAEAAYAEYQEDEDNFYLEGMAMGLCEAAKQLSAARTIVQASDEEKCV